MILIIIGIIIITMLFTGATSKYFEYVGGDAPLNFLTWVIVGSLILFGIQEHNKKEDATTHRINKE